MVELRDRNLIAQTKAAKAAAAAAKEAPMVRLKKAKNEKAAELSTVFDQTADMSANAALLYSAVSRKLDVGKLLRAFNDKFLPAVDAGKTVDTSGFLESFCDFENLVCVWKNDCAAIEDEDDLVLFGLSTCQNFLGEVFTKDARDIDQYRIKLRFEDCCGISRPASRAFFFKPDGKMGVRGDDLMRVLRDLCAEFIE